MTNSTPENPLSGPIGSGPPANRPADQLATWGQRAAAVVLDMVFLSVLIGIVVLLFTFVGLAMYGGVELENMRDIGSAVALTLVLSTVIGLIASIMYYALMIRSGARNGQTLGKQIIGIRVVSEDGSPVSWKHVLLREVVARTVVLTIGMTLVNLIAAPLGFFVFVAWYLMPLWDQKYRCPHDAIASTRVVED